MIQQSQVSPLTRKILYDLSKARELIKVQISFGSGYNRNAAKLILAEVQKEHGQVYVDQLINVNLEEAFGFKPGSIFSY